MTYTSPSTEYQHVPIDSALQPDSTYRLRRYLWRACLSIIGPLLVLGFWAFICFYYLNRSPENGIILDIYVDALGPNYAWTAISIFALDWGRTAVSNFQAAAIMRPRFSPANAVGLFWHVDDNWANPLWWLRAVRNISISSLTQRHRSRPGWFWWFLSFMFMLFFLAIPLSSLAMQLTSILTLSGQRAQITGPKDTTFNLRGWINPASIVYGMWKAGGVATPPDASYFYAPTGSRNVSLTYYEDSKDLETIKTFLGPGVNGLVAGTTSGLESSISCSQVAAEDLRLLVVHDIADYEPSSSLPTGSYQWFNETGYWSGRNVYSMVMAAVGAWYGDTPYDNVSNFDYSVGDPQGQYVKLEDLPDSYMEFYIYQGVYPNFTDPVIETLLQNTSSMYKKTNTAPYIDGLTYRDYTPFTTVGFGVQCRVRSAYGHAKVLPTTRTYENFTFANTTSGGGDQDVYPPQMIAVQALGNWDGSGSYQMRPRTPTGPDSTWLAMHPAINEPAYNVCTSDCTAQSMLSFTSGYGQSAYMSLSPQNVTFALQRLLGKSLVVMMSGGAQAPWEGDLFLLKPANWLTTGVVSWQLVLVLLSLWTIIITFVSIWSMFTRRWAPVLSAFDLFRFGAQYTEQINKLDAHEWERCKELNNIPGMVGELSGESVEGSIGFIGLSDDVASQTGSYVYDRRAAGKIRSP